MKTSLQNGAATGLAVAAVWLGGLASPLAEPGAAAQGWASGAEKKASAPVEGAPLLLIEPRSMSSEVSVLISDARETVFTAAFQGKLGARAYTRSAFREAFPKGWKDFFEGRRASLAEHLKSLEPKLVRNKDKVIEYALIQSDHPLTPAVILAPGFAEMFTESLGDQLLIAIPDRSSIFVFPKLAGTLETHREGLGDLFDDAIYPVSEEVFELTKDGIRVVGAFRVD